MEACEYGLTRGTCFVARHLEVVAVAGLLWISWCVLGAAGFIFVFFFRFFFFERTRPAANMGTPCLIYLSTSSKCFAKVVRVPVLRVPVLLASRTLWTAGTQSFRPPGYPVDWRDSVLLAPRYPVDWRDSVLSATRYLVDWRDSVFSATKYPGDWRE